jgi:hypothetical protein
MAGGYLCTVDAYDHARPPDSAAVPARADVLAAADPSATTCVREASGITCTEEIVVVAPRRARPPVLVSQRDVPPARAEALPR